MLEKTKEFCGKHDMIVWFAVGAAAGFGLYRLGYSTAVRRIYTGLSMCCLAKPELGPMLDEAIETVGKSVGKLK